MVSRLDATHAGTTPEPASALLRRLHEEAHRGLSEYAAKQFLRNALPALADLVEAGDEMAALVRKYGPTLSDRAARTLDAWDERLAALRATLGAKP